MAVIPSHTVAFEIRKSGERVDSYDRQLIIDLAERIRTAPSGHKDAQAAELIQREIGGQRDALYIMTQAVLVQEDALKTAQAKIAELNDQLASSPSTTTPSAPSGGGFMASMFGSRTGGTATAPSPAGPSSDAPATASQRSSFGGGGFLKTAAAAAAGVAGGQLLFQGLSNAFGGGDHGGDTHGATHEATHVTHEHHQAPADTAGYPESDYSQDPYGEENF